MKEQSKFSMLLKYGPREDQLWKTLDQFSKKGVFPENRNEIIRRGLHSARYLAEINDQRLLWLLRDQLDSISEDFSPKNLKAAKDLSLAIFATLITKEGIARAEAFENIPTNLMMYTELLAKEGVKDVIPELQAKIAELKLSLETVFLEPKPRAERLEEMEKDLVNRWETDAFLKVLVKQRAELMQDHSKESHKIYTS